MARELGLPVPEVRVALRSGDTPASQRAAHAAKAAAHPDHHARVALPADHGGEEPRDPARRAHGDRRRDPRRRARQARLAPRAHARAARALSEHAAGADRAVGDAAPIETYRACWSARARSQRADGTPRCTIVDVGHRRTLDLALELPDGELEAVASAEQLADVLDGIAEHVQSRRTTLVFVNTRRLAERLAHLLDERLGEDGVAAHHGSLSKERRLASRRGCARASCRRWSRPRRSSSASTSGRSSWSARSARRAASRPSCSASGARATASAARRRGGCIRPRATSWSSARRCCAACARVGSTRCIRRTRRSTSSRSRSWPPARPRTGRKTTLFALMCRAAPPTHGSRAATSTRWSRCSPRASRPGAVGAAPICTATASTACCAGAAARGSPRSPRAARFPRPPTTASSPIPTTPSSAPSTRTGRSRAWPATSSCSAARPGRSAASSPAWCASPTPRARRRRSRSGSARRRRAREELSRRGVGAARRASRASWRAAIAAGARGWLERGVRARRGRRRADRRATSRRRAPRSARLPDPQRARGRALLRRDRRHAARGARAASAGAQPRARPRAAQALLQQLRLRAPGGGQRRRHGALARPAAQLPARRRAALPASRAASRDALAQAVLASPMFTARWRWNLNRSLAVLRFRGGKQQSAADPAHGGRRSDGRDLSRARRLPGERRPGRSRSPTTRSCARRSTTACTRRWTSTASRRCVEAHRVRRRCATHLRRHDRAVAARPRDPERPALHLPRRRAARRAPHPRGALRRGLARRRARSRAARPGSDRARARRGARPSRATPKSCTTCCSRSWSLRPSRGLARACSTRSSRRARRSRSSARDGRALWLRGRAPRRWRGVLFPSAGLDARRRALPAALDADAGARTPRPSSVAVRGHLDVLGPDRRSRRSRARPGSREIAVELALARLEAEGFALRGRFEPRRGARGRAVCARARLLARIHAYTQERLRREIEPVTAQDFMRFLLRWQHVAPDTRREGRRGAAGGGRAAPGLRARRGRLGGDACCRRASAGYRAGWLDELCLSGEVVWGRLSRERADCVETPDRAERGARPGARRRAPVARDAARALRCATICPGCCAAARGDAAPRRARRPVRRATSSSACASAARSSTPSSRSDSGRLPVEVEEGLWELVVARPRDRGRLPGACARCSARASAGRAEPRDVGRGAACGAALARGARGAEGRWGLLPRGRPRRSVETPR